MTALRFKYVKHLLKPVEEIEELKEEGVPEEEAIAQVKEKYEPAPTPSTPPPPPPSPAPTPTPTPEPVDETEGEWKRVGGEEQVPREVAGYDITREVGESKVGPEAHIRTQLYQTLAWEQLTSAEREWAEVGIREIALDWPYRGRGTGEEFPIRTLGQEEGRQLAVARGKLWWAEKRLRALEAHALGSPKAYEEYKKFHEEKYIPAFETAKGAQEAYKTRWETEHRFLAKPATQYLALPGEKLSAEERAFFKEKYTAPDITMFTEREQEELRRYRTEQAALKHQYLRLQRLEKTVGATSMERELATKYILPVPSPTLTPKELEGMGLSGQMLAQAYRSKREAWHAKDPISYMIHSFAAMGGEFAGGFAASIESLAAPVVGYPRGVPPPSLMEGITAPARMRRISYEFPFYGLGAAAGTYAEMLLAGKVLKVVTKPLAWGGRQVARGYARFLPRVMPSKTKLRVGEAAREYFTTVPARPHKWITTAKGITFQRPGMRGAVWDIRSTLKPTGGAQRVSPHLIREVRAGEIVYRTPAIQREFGYTLMRAPERFAQKMVRPWLRLTDYMKPAQRLRVLAAARPFEAATVKLRVGQQWGIVSLVRGQGGIGMRLAGPTTTKIGVTDTRQFLGLVKPTTTIGVKPSPVSQLAIMRARIGKRFLRGWGAKREVFWVGAQPYGGPSGAVPMPSVGQITEQFGGGFGKLWIPAESELVRFAPTVVAGAGIAALWAQQPRRVTAPAIRPVYQVRPRRMVAPALKPIGRVRSFEAMGEALVPTSRGRVGARPMVGTEAALRATTLTQLAQVATQASPMPVESLVTAPAPFPFLEPTKRKRRPAKLPFDPLGKLYRERFFPVELFGPSPLEARSRRGGKRRKRGERRPK